MNAVRRDIHVAVPGQFDNVGDTMHRRVLLDWLRRAGDLRVLIGQAPASFETGLHLREGDETFTSTARWLRSISWQQRPAIAFNPGEMNLGRRRAAREGFLYPVLRGIRSCRGDVVRVGIASGGDGVFTDRLTERILRRSIALSTHLAWREHPSQQLFGSGAIIPDLAFATGNLSPATPVLERSRLAVTMRFDRPLPSEEWVKAVRSFASQENLEIVVTSQVRRDNDRSDELARILDGRADLWVDRNHREQEVHLRELYSTSRCVVSDRLHALIAATTEGAVPVGLLVSPSSKIPIHFAVIGAEVGLSTGALTSAEIENHLWEAVDGADRIRQQAEDARSVLESFGENLVASLA